MLKHDDITIALGPPGCGKTTSLLDLVIEDLAMGVDPEKIGFVSFTKAAVWEATSRASGELALDTDRFEWFRTIHSLCYKCLGMRNSGLMLAKDYSDFMNKRGVPYSGALSGGEFFPGNKPPGDEAIYYMHLSRAMEVPLTYPMRGSIGSLTPRQLEKINSDVEEYKERFGLLDFTDLLEKFARGEGFCPELERLYVDEAQDLSRLQWRVIARIAERTKMVTVAGDDDQAIFSWAGADVETFLSLRGKRRVLSQSYRLPRSIYDLATSVTARIAKRYDKPFNAKKSGAGLIKQVNGIEDVEMSEGSWLVLARDRYPLRRVMSYFYQMGILFEMSGEDTSEKTQAVRAILLWERLRKGKRVGWSDVRLVYKHMKIDIGVQRGHKLLRNVDMNLDFSIDELEQHHGLLTRAPWYEALSKIPLDRVEYFRAVMRHGEQITSDARVILSTIHGAKGMEADNVVLFSDATRSSHEAYLRSPDPELRVTYVGLTRSKNALFIVKPRDIYKLPIYSK